MLDGEEELRAFLGIAPDYAGLRVIFDRRDKNTVRNVYVLDDRVLIKTFTEHPGKRDRKTPWKQEHTALQWLKGLPVPESLGYDTLPRRDGRTMFVLRKTYLPGQPIEMLTAQSIRLFAELMGAMNARGVVANDPARANVLQQSSGGLAMFDFGKAKCFRWKSPYFWWYLGKEHGQVFSGFCNRDAGPFREYHARYLRTPGAPDGWRRRLMELGFRRACDRRGIEPPELAWR